MIFAKVWLDRESLREQLKDCSAAFDRQQEMLDRNAEQLAALRAEVIDLKNAVEAEKRGKDELREQLAALREALSRLVEVHDAMGGMCSPERILAEEALAKEVVK